MPIDVNNCQQTRATLSFAGNQALFRRTQNNDFYSIVPSPYFTYYQNWVRVDLAWYDGYVPWIHGGTNGLLSTGIGTSIVNRCADSVFGGSLMFKNARKPQDKKNGIGVALDFISNKWMNETDGEQVIKKTARNALAGGFSALKLNNAGGVLWLDGLRADRFYADLSHGKVMKFGCALAFFNGMTSKEDQTRYVLIEERRFENLGLFEKIPVVEYKIYATSAPIQFYQGAGNENFIPWEQLPKIVRSAFKEQYGSMMLNKPQALNGFSDLGVYILNASDGISAIPDLEFGESILNNVETYLYEYDYWNTALNTEMYLSRGRVIVPKRFISPLAELAGSRPNGLDEFLYTECDASPNGEPNKPQPVQFELRAEQFRSIRDTLLQCIAAGIGISVSTLASYLNDGGAQKTAHQVDSETDATTKWVEAMRRRFEKPINAMLAQVLRFYGYTDDVEVRWTRAGFTNQSELVTTLSAAINAGMISRKKAHHQFNIDEDEEQNEQDYKQVLEEEKARNQSEKENLWDFGDKEEVDG